MHIVPVIDLLRGRVVHAKRGERSGYLPVQSALCTGSEPLEMVRAFLELHDFDVMYIADLDAITGNGNNHDIISSIHRQYPGLILWLDNGSTSITPSPALEAIVPVIGSETGMSAQELAGLKRRGKKYILSLDFSKEGFTGDDEWLHATSDWPDDIIIMNLSRVGTALGPDYSLLDDIRKLAGNRHLYCGGGVRSGTDLQLLKKNGIHGALLATALHNRTIGKSAIRKVSGDQ